jgi:hypothetical protein
MQHCRERWIEIAAYSADRAASGFICYGRKVRSFLAAWRGKPDAHDHHDSCTGIIIIDHAHDHGHDHGHHHGPRSRT